MPVDPSAVKTWANLVTVARVLIAPIMFLLIPEKPGGSWVAFGLWFVLCLTDGIDGYLARRHGATTVGAFLDPLADKVLVLGAMFFLVNSHVYLDRPGHHHRRPRAGDQLVPHVRRRQGGQCPGQQDRQVQDPCPATLGGFRHRPVDRHRCEVAVERVAVDLRGAGIDQRQPVHVAGALGRGRSSVRCDVVAVGTELLLGQIVDTNSAWIGEHLASNGIDSLLQVKVGDNLGRVEAVLRSTLANADAVIVCGGLGPTHDDLTREAIAAVMGVELRQDDSVAAVITEMFASRNRYMAANNLRQAMVPVGATVIPQTRGTAPGLICPVTIGGVDKVMYAVPGVPHEMKEMVERAVLPDLRRRSGDTSAIVSRTLRTWGESESGLNERLDALIARLDDIGNPTLAFLASGWEGLEGAPHRQGGDSGRRRIAARQVGCRSSRRSRRARLRRRRRDDGVGDPGDAAVAGPHARRWPNR